jgi:hypothetical protein
VFNQCQRNEEGARRLREEGKPVSCQGLQKWNLLRLYSEAGGRKFLQNIGSELKHHISEENYLEMSVRTMS